MPTYDYKCSKCGHIFEAFQKMSDAPLNNCPQCKTSGSVKRMIGSGAGFIFKGSGFYSTDYKKSGSSQAVKPECSDCSQSQCPKAEKNK